MTMPSLVVATPADDRGGGAGDAGRRTQASLSGVCGGLLVPPVGVTAPCDDEQADGTIVAVRNATLSAALRHGSTARHPLMCDGHERRTARRLPPGGIEPPSTG
jgi:hypothetical protein